MKILKTILYILLAIVLILVLLGFAGPKDYDVSRTLAINAPKELVFPYLKSLKKQNDWGPWKKHDPDMQVTYEGEDGTVGAMSRWEGKVAGKGTQQISSITGTTVNTELTFIMPWGESKSTGYFHAAEATGGTEVTWGLSGENDFLGRIMGVFMNMDKNVGPMFDEGLQSLKQLIESDVSKEYKGFKVQLVDFPPKQYVGARSKIAMADIANFMGQQFGRISTAVGPAMNGAPTGLYYSWDEATGMTDMVAAIPVSSATTVPDTEVISLPAGKALVIDYYGAYDGLANAHMAMDEFSQTTGVKTKAPAIEEYLSDPMSEPDPKKWLTRIYYLLDQ